MQFHKTHEQTWLKKPELAKRLCVCVYTAPRKHVSIVRFGFRSTHSVKFVFLFAKDGFIYMVLVWCLTPDFSLVNIKQQPH